ncbi:TIGR04076 family protein [Megasphaera vaginalis (ex Srinivasan et al. 2021)]|uniref:TIGR04076 family protein n=2 Tax=Megasphaera vaginalis (ex Srinivasan et al. 2021) TaxID=1111454 RepID=U7UT77_9FIRM|nr:TIGR04076 family protein [Megasphaera vaginalis (ex Srinivasan et al. 2021)]
MHRIECNKGVSVQGGGLMQYKVKVTVIDKKLYPNLQEAYCADPDAGVCPCYNVGDVFLFERYGTQDDFWRMGIRSLQQSIADENTVAGGPVKPHCSEAWDAISRYIYTGLQGGAVMRGWMKDEHIMIACCSDGTRPVIFKIERLDYKVMKLQFFDYMSNAAVADLRTAVMAVSGVFDVAVRRDKHFVEVYMDRNHEVADDVLKASLGAYDISLIE